MAEPILEDQAIDYSKPFVVDFTHRDSRGMKRSTQPITPSSVEGMVLESRRGSGP
jgi:hypothetical protein